MKYGISTPLVHHAIPLEINRDIAQRRTRVAAPEAAVDELVFVDVAQDVGFGYAFAEEEVGDGHVAGRSAADGEVERYGALVSCQF